jgi:hypothetical protein
LAALRQIQGQLSAHQEIIRRLNPVVSLTSFEELPQVMTGLVETNKQTGETLSRLQMSYETLQGEHKTLEELHQNFEGKHKKLLESLSESISFDDESSLVSSVAQLVSQCTTLQKEKKDSNLLLTQLRQMLDCSSDMDLPSAVEKLHQDLTQAKDEHSRLLTSLREFCVFDHETELIQRVGHLQSESRELVKVKACQEQIISALSDLYELKSFDELPATVKSLSATVSQARKLAGIDEVARLPELIESNQSTIQELNGQLATAAGFLPKILSRVFKRTVGVSFPLEPSLLSKIIKGFEDYADNSEALQANVDALLSTARGVGYSGTSCVGASDFLADELCKKKAQEHLEAMVSQMKQLREDKERERQVFEQRNAANLQKLKELRQSKAALIEQSAAKQAELYDTIEALEKDSRDLELRVDQLQRVKDELIRLCSNDVYDQETLRNLLSSSERLKLKL